MWEYFKFWLALELTPLLIVSAVLAAVFMGIGLIGLVEKLKGLFRISS